MDVDFHLFGDGSWQDRLAWVVDTTREISRQTDPQTMVKLYAERMRALNPVDHWMSVTRRGLEPPLYRIARSTRWRDHPDPWKERDRLPVFQGGFIGELFEAAEPRLVNDFQPARDDPAREFLREARSLIAIPIWDGGEVLNLTLQMRSEPDAFDPEQFPLTVWITNLFARSTHNLVVSKELREARDQLARDAEVIAEIQRSLLPEDLPAMPNLEVAVHYEASETAGGDYYDILPLPDGKRGILVADVSGHGTPAAVLMAITHAITHLYPGDPLRPSWMLAFLNDKLHARYTRSSGAFVTAFYGVYDPATRELDYALAGHPHPRLRRAGAIRALEPPARPPLGILRDQSYVDARVRLEPDDELVIYTDGITEAQNTASDLFGVERLDDAVRAAEPGAGEVCRAIIGAVAGFTDGRRLHDDTTLLVARVR